MVNTNALNLWYKATGESICGHHDCIECHKIYDMNICPIDVDVDEETLSAFVSRVTETLRKLDEEMPFGLDISDEELVNILKQAATVDE